MQFMWKSGNGQKHVQVVGEKCQVKSVVLCRKEYTGLQDGVCIFTTDWLRNTGTEETGNRAEGHK